LRAVIALVDTNVLVRHLIGEPPDQAARATELLRDARELLLVDLVVAETVDVLESFYEQPRERVATLVRALLGLPSIRVVDERLLRRALELYEYDRLDFAEAYLAALAEVTGVGAVMSFDRSIDRVASVRRLA
jgi:predicted nucleic-acid-binding protein